MMVAPLDLKHPPGSCATAAGICDLAERAGNHPIFFDGNHFSERWIIEHGDQIFSEIL